MVGISDVKSEGNKLEKSPTGIKGLDEITEGGLPRGRTTLVCGTAGCGKTLLSMQFLAGGALKYGEPGVFMAFEENADDLTKNFSSMGFGLERLIEENRILIDHVRIDPSEIEETGDYDLEGLFIRLGTAIDSIGAKRVVLDTIEVLFSGFENDVIIRSELRRLFGWLKKKGVTAIVTGEKGENTLTRYGLEEYVADCVIFLDARMVDQISTRRLRVIKYRGSRHGTNEYPFMIEDKGIIVLPITSLGLEHKASTDRIPTGIERLDYMLDGKGYFQGSSILISGTAGTGKTSFAAHFVDSACKRGDQCLYFAFEESPGQIIRNMRSIGIDLEPWRDAGLLKIRALRPMACGLETHLTELHRCIDEFRPKVVVMDPISNLINVGTPSDVRSMLTRLVDYMKSLGITAFSTSLVDLEREGPGSGQGVSSLMDTWLKLNIYDNGSETNRGISIVKSRGMKHSNQIREYLLTDDGVKILDVYLGPEGGLLMGAARASQEAKEKADAETHGQEQERRKRVIENRLKSLDAQMTVLRSEFEKEEMEMKRLVSEDELLGRSTDQNREDMARLRSADLS